MRAALLVLLVAACGDNLEGLDPDAFNIAARDQQCAYLLRCGLIRDVDSCRQTKVATWAPGWHLSPRHLAGIAAGHVLWNETEAARCVRQALSCDVSRHEDLHCPDLYEGVMHDSEPCMSDIECISDRCWIQDTATACSIGYCIGDTPPVRGHIGDACSNDNCLEGWCDGATCQPRAPEGAECNGVTYNQCEDGLRCYVSPDGFSRTCVHAPDRGEPCDHVCARIGDVCSLDHVCVALRARGWTCGRDEDCSPFDHCFKGICTERPAVGPGKPCAGTFECADAGECYSDQLFLPATCHAVTPYTCSE